MCGLVIRKNFRKQLKSFESFDVWKDFCSNYKGFGRQKNHSIIYKGSMCLWSAADILNNFKCWDNASNRVFNANADRSYFIYSDIHSCSSICRRLSCFYTAAMLGIFCDNVMDCTVYRKIHAPNVFLGDYNIVVDRLHRCFFAVAGRRSK